MMEDIVMVSIKCLRRTKEKIGSTLGQISLPEAGGLFLTNMYTLHCDAMQKTL